MYYREIDGLRALAVILVIINHAFPVALPNGYLGVDIFFVISGFVITRLLVERSHLSLGEFLMSFYNSRLKRLMPALLLVVMFTSQPR